MFYVDKSIPLKVITSSEVKDFSNYQLRLMDLKVKTEYKNGRGHYEVDVHKFFPCKIGSLKSLVEIINMDDDSENAKENIKIISSYLLKRILANKDTTGRDPAGITGYKQVCKDYEAIRKMEKELM